MEVWLAPAVMDTFSSDLLELSDDDSSPSVTVGFDVDAHRAMVGPVLGAPL